jgi:hypothetical protein
MQTFLIDNPAESLPAAIGVVRAVMPPLKRELIDRFGRRITDLRVSVTDRCNYRCVYCRTGNEGAPYAELPMADYLRLVRVFVSLGIEKIRLTGGEPLLRKGLVELPTARRSTLPLLPTATCSARSPSLYAMRV